MGEATGAERVILAYSDQAIGTGTNGQTGASGVAGQVLPADYTDFDNTELVVYDPRNNTTTFLDIRNDWLTAQTDGNSPKIGAFDQDEAGSRQWLTWTPSTRTFGRGGQSATANQIIRIVGVRLYDDAGKRGLKGDKGDTGGPLPDGGITNDVVAKASNTDQDYKLLRLPAVALSGNYSDLSGRPSLPRDTTAWKGNFAGNAAYGTGDIVVYRGEIFIALVAIPSSNSAVPVDGNVWAHLSIDVDSAALVAAIFGSPTNKQIIEYDAANSRLIFADPPPAAKAPMVLQTAVATGSSPRLQTLTLPSNYTNWRNLTLSIWLSGQQHISSRTIPTSLLSVQIRDRIVIGIEYSTQLLQAIFTPSTRVLDLHQKGTNQILYASLED